MIGREEGAMKAEKLFDVGGNVALVTGAASGLGLAMAEVMAENGARVCLVDADAAGLETAVARLRQAGLAVEAVVADVADADSLAHAVNGTAAKFGRLDAVFANAGITSGPGFALAAEGAIEALPPALWQRVIAVNLSAVFHTLQLAAVVMKRQRSGRIIVTSSIAGLKAETMVGYGYIASKAAVNNLVRQAAVELAPYNVLVNAICPGPFMTNIAGGRGHRDPAVRAKFAAMVPLGRLALPDEIKGLALLLASPAGSFITGAVIPIDGGSTA
jgi:NAD(P)-dependent dehydrogenase (short-subunit alcohol dehydrogenase family)